MPFASSEMPPVYPRCSTHCKLHLVFYLPELQMFNDLQRSLLADIANIRLDANDPAWAQAVLPVWSGGLGVWSASQLAPSAFWPQLLAPSSSPTRSSQQGYRRHPVLLSMWPSPSGPVGMMSPPPPSAPASFLQNSWDAPRVKLAYRDLLESASDAPAQARLLAALAKESGAWLHVLPVSLLGLRMDNEVVRVAMGLRLGVTLCHPHVCQHCHNQVDHQGLHGLHRPSFLFIII